MKKTKLLVIFCISLLIVGICNFVFAADTQTHITTTTINGVTAKWEYRLNDSNQIIDLKCINPSELKGSIAIPSNLDGKTVINLGDEAFIKANNVTEFILPSTVKEIGYRAFENCTKLSKIDLGSIEKISPATFENCTALTSIKIPKTLKDGPTIIDSYVFANCTNLTTITLEEGLEIIPTRVLAGTNITELKIPASVKKIDSQAIIGCKSLKNVDLGSVEEIGSAAFENCTALTSIKIPKTLKDGPTIIDSYVFANCTNLTTITLEEGLEIIPTRVLAGTNITELKIPASVKTIDKDAFLNCTKLTKIEIYDSVKDIYGLKHKNDEVFTNHNENLTIYCYKDSIAAQYAIIHNIKYVYLTKDEENRNNTVTNSTTNNTVTNITTNNPNKGNTVDDTTIKDGVLPKTGIEFGLIITIISLAGVGIFIYFKYNNLKDI